MKGKLNSFLEKNIPFVLFRAPGQSTRLVAQLSPLDSNLDFQQTGFHFAPFSGRENVPYLIIKNEIDQVIKTENDFPDIQINLSPFGGGNGEGFSHKEKSVTHHQYLSDLQSYFDFFGKKQIRKAIYSRIKKVDLASEFDIFSFFKKIESAYPRELVYIANLPGVGLWAGASPETLLKYNNGIAETVALAGTQKIFEGQRTEDLIWGKKEIEEHQMVADYIFEKIKSHDLEIIEQSATYTSQAGAMAHLKQKFQFKISLEQLSNFIKELRPTPAVCGLPKQKALDLIYEIEPYDRQYYAGYLGMVEENNSVDFYVNLSSMKLEKSHAKLFVGGGITQNSNPQKEWQETELKAKTLLVGLALAEPKTI